MQQEQLVTNVVEEVLKQIGSGHALRAAPVSAGTVAISPGTPVAGSSQTSPSSADASASSGPGIFSSVDAAVDAAAQAQRQLAETSLAVRAGIGQLLKQMARDNAQRWGRFELDETKIGRLDHKIVKLELLEAVPGVEFLETATHSGDAGVSLDEAAPWGVIGVVTPVTHSIPTLVSNALSMVSAGNAMVVNPHPGGARSACLAAGEYNKAIKERFNIDPLMCLIDPPTLRTAEEIFKHPGIPLLAVTGGPGVARAAMKQSKRAIVAGPGNPPVVVDETADFDKAARAIITGAAFDNNLLCIGEKEVFVVAAVFDAMIEAMRRAGAVELSSKQIDQLAEAVFTHEKGHYAVKKEFVGADTQVLGELVGVTVPPGVDLLFGETDQMSPFVSEEQMMPFVPFVRAADFSQAVDLAIKYEHGFGHTAVIHSNNLDNITKMGRAVNTTLFVANGPSTACLGAGGEGYASYSIATPTGEGVTNPLTFTRFRRFSVSDSMRIV